MRVLAIVCVIACTPPGPRAPEPHPTLASPADMYNSQIVALRTTLGRAAIELEARGIDRAIATPQCRDGAPAGGGCVRCELAGASRAIDGATLEAITTAFDRYPTAVLTTARIERVALCKHIEHDVADTAGIADHEDRRLMISLEPFAGKLYEPYSYFTIEDIVHHEMFHLLESAVMADKTDDDPEWLADDPPGFSYGPASRDGRRPPGFVDPYAATNVFEDRASVFQYVMARPEELCELARHDALVRAKTAVIWRRVAAVTGDAFLRTRAECIDWIDAAR